MTSPRIDEKQMVAFLRQPHADNADNIARIQGGLTLLIIDAYDRKITRDQFVATVSSAVTLNDHLGHYDMILSMKDHFKEFGSITPSDLEVTLQSLLKKVEVATERCARIGEMLKECPEDEDVIH